MELPEAKYIHGSHEEEQTRLSRLNTILNDACMEKMHFSGKERILDVGCGLGQFSRHISKQLNKEGVVVGIERDVQQFNKACALAEEAQEAHLVNFRLGSAYDLPLEPAEWQSFDVVFTRFLLEHLAEPSKAVAQMAKAVKIGGKVILTDDDHATYRPSPEPLGFSIIWTAYVRSYERLGNDPFIGRKLVSLLHENELKPSRLTSVFFGACQGEDKFELVATNLVGILEGAETLMIREGLISKPSFDKCIKELQEWMLLPDAALFYSIDWAEGTKLPNNKTRLER